VNTYIPTARTMSYCIFKGHLLNEVVE